MATKVICAACGLRHGDRPDEWRGRTTRCLGCGETFVVASSVPATSNGRIDGPDELAQEWELAREWEAARNDNDNDPAAGLLDLRHCSFEALLLYWVERSQFSQRSDMKTDLMAMRKDMADPYSCALLERALTAPSGAALHDQSAQLRAKALNTWEVRHRLVHATMLEVTGGKDMAALMARLRDIAAEEIDVDTALLDPSAKPMLEIEKPALSLDQGILEMLANLRQIVKNTETFGLLIIDPVQTASPDFDRSLELVLSSYPPEELTYFFDNSLRSRTAGYEARMRITEAYCAGFVEGLSPRHLFDLASVWFPETFPDYDAFREYVLGMEHG